MCRVVWGQLTAVLFGLDGVHTWLETSSESLGPELGRLTQQGLGRWAL